MCFIFHYWLSANIWPQHLFWHKNAWKNETGKATRIEVLIKHYAGQHLYKTISYSKKSSDLKKHPVRQPQPNGPSPINVTDDEAAVSYCFWHAVVSKAWKTLGSPAQKLSTGRALGDICSRHPWDLIRTSLAPYWAISVAGMLGEGGRGHLRRTAL